jgi:predicted MFS family arabinose efflux permease
VRDTAGLTRETIHPIVIYEAQKTGFLNLIGKLRGMEYLLQALGTLLTWWVFRTMGGQDNDNSYLGNFALGGGILIIGCIWWMLFFKEDWKPDKQPVIPLRELVNLDMNPNLVLIAMSGMIFAIGLQMSHSFYMNLFFTERFKSTTDFTIWVNIVHRLTLALPLFIVGHFNLKNLKWWYIFGVAFQGLAIAISPFINSPVLSASVYLSHDLIGAGIWSPIQATLIQRFSSDEKRGLEVGKVLAWGSIGAIFGPLIAGKLASQSSTLPFFFSGVIIIAAIAPLFFLKLSRDEGAKAAA